MNREAVMEQINMSEVRLEIAEKLCAAESAEDMAGVLGEYGVSVTAEELNDLLAAAPAEGELSKEDLVAVSGGCFLSRKDIILLAVKYGWFAAMLKRCRNWQEVMRLVHLFFGW